MLVINKSQVDLVEGRPELVTEASAIGLKPGEWPEWISVVDDNGRGFLFGPGATFERSEGDIMAARYHTQNGGAATLTVIND